MQVRDIVVDLPGGMGIELHPDIVRGNLDLRFVCAASKQVRHLIEMLGKQHFLLREGQGIDGVILKIFPVDQLVDHEIVGLERQHIADHLDVEFLFFGKVLHLRYVAEIVQRKGAVSFGKQGDLACVSHEVLRQACDGCV